MYFYPRSPCGERLRLGQNPFPVPGQFLSTLSLRRATCRRTSESYKDRHFYPRSPCGERQLRKLLYPGSTRISIHALLAESDTVSAVLLMYNLLFLSTLSLRRATQSSAKSTPEEAISIHALLAESDKKYRLNVAPAQAFLSTLSLRRATLLAM